MMLYNTRKLLDLMTIKKISSYFIILLITSFSTMTCYSIEEKLSIKDSSNKQGTVAVNFTPTIPTFKFSEIPAGNFIMGSPPTETDRAHAGNEDQILVEITKPFEITTTEVTQKQWFLIMGNNPSILATTELDLGNSVNCNKQIINGVEICPDHPVYELSWDDTQEYIKRLNSLLNLKGCDGTPQSSSGCYRLPTEAEWEYAVRAGTKTAYFFGDDPAELEDYAWYRQISKKDKTGFRKVGLKNPNPWGLYDVYGNVGEWVQDGVITEETPYIGLIRILGGKGWFKGWYKKWDDLPGGKDPLLNKLPSSLDRINKITFHDVFVLWRIKRGSSAFMHAEWGLRSAWRWITVPDNTNHSGFRLVRQL